MPRAGFGVATPWPPVFPFSVDGMPTTCKCTWQWDHDRKRFTRTVRRDDCIWCLLSRVAMVAPADALELTTLMITRSQRAQMSDIQADLVLSAGRHVTLRETFSELLKFWKENHPHGDETQG